MGSFREWWDKVRDPEIKLEMKAFESCLEQLEQLRPSQADRVARMLVEYCRRPPPTNREQVNNND